MQRTRCDSIKLQPVKSALLKSLPLKSNEERFNNNVLYLNIAKDLQTQAERNIKTFEWALENLEFDFIYRTTTTAYINLEKIYKNIQNKKAENYYSAPEVRYKEIKFGSGAGYFLSKDLVQLVVDNKHNWDYSLLDDVALGKLLNSLNKKLTPNSRQDFKYYPSFNEIDLNQFHYRFRIDLYGYPRFLEILILLSIHRKIEYMKNVGTNALYLINIFDIFNKILFSMCKFFNFVFIYRVCKKKLKSSLKSLLN